MRSLALRLCTILIPILLLPLGACTGATTILADPSLPWVTSKVEAPGVEYHQFQSRTTGTTVSFHLYVPPQYHDGSEHLPVLYWLHGTSGGLKGIAPLANHFDGAMRAGTVPPMLVVFVNGLPKRLWADSKSGSSPVETLFITEVIPMVERLYRTIPKRSGRILEGFSMGGYGAARLGMKYPELFGSISVLAGGPLDLELRGPKTRNNAGLRAEILREVCSDDLEYFRSISPITIAESMARTPQDKRPLMRLVVGELDETRALKQLFHQRLTDLGVAHTYTEYPGIGHDALALLKALEESSEEGDTGSFYRRASKER